MGTARQVQAKYPTNILDINYRKRQLEFRRRQVSQWLENETELLKMEIESKGAADKLPEDYISERLASIESEAKRQESEALATFGMLVGNDPTISPLRRALAVWGLTIDDVGVASVRFSSLFAVSRRWLTLALPFSSSTEPRPSPTTKTSRTLTTSSSATSDVLSETPAPSSPRSGSPVTPREEPPPG